MINPLLSLRVAIEDGHWSPQPEVRLKPDYDGPSAGSVDDSPTGRPESSVSLSPLTCGVFGSGGSIAYCRKPLKIRAKIRQSEKTILTLSYEKVRMAFYGVIVSRRFSRTSAGHPKEATTRAEVALW